MVENLDITVFKILAAFPTQLTLFSKMAGTFAIWLVVASLAYFQVSTVHMSKKKRCMLKGNSQNEIYEITKTDLLPDDYTCILYSV